MRLFLEKALSAIKLHSITSFLTLAKHLPFRCSKLWRYWEFALNENTWRWIMWMLQLKFTKKQPPQVFLKISRNTSGRLLLFTENYVHGMQKRVINSNKKIHFKFVMNFKWNILEINLIFSFSIPRLYPRLVLQDFGDGDIFADHFKLAISANTRSVP